MGKMSDPEMTNEEQSTDMETHETNSNMDVEIDDEQLSNDWLCPPYC